MLGAEFLRKNEYYRFRQNHFWDLIFLLFGENFKDDYIKKGICYRKNIVIRDVIKNCEREGSLDTNIKDSEVNDFNSLFKEYPNIKRVFFNGEMAEKLFRKLISKDIKYLNIGLISLPSARSAVDI